MRPSRGQGTLFETEAAGCRGTAETETGKKLPPGKAAASRTTSLTVDTSVASDL